MIETENVEVKTLNQIVLRQAEPNCIAMKHLKTNTWNILRRLENLELKLLDFAGKLRQTA